MLSQAIDAIKEALKLTDEVRRAGETLKELAQEVRDHDRRITRLEAQWDTAAMLSRNGWTTPVASPGLYPWLGTFARLSVSSIANGLGAVRPICHKGLRQ